MPSLLDRILEKEAQRPSEPQQRPSLEAQRLSLDVIGGGTAKSYAQRVRERENLQEQGIHAQSVSEADRVSRESAITAEIRAKGFSDATISEPGLPDVGVRFDLGLSDTFAEKHAKFMDKFPEGDFVEVPEPAPEAGRTSIGRGSRTILFRKNQHEPFAEVDAGLLDKFELLGDLADLSGELPAAAVEAYVTKGGSIVRTALRMFYGNVIGDSFKEIIESLRDYQKETFGEQTKRIGARSGTAAIVGGPLTSLTMTGPANIYRGTGIINVLPGAKEAQIAAREIGIPAFLPNQIASSPIIQRIGKQSRATVDTINQYMRRQAESAVRALSKLRDTDALQFAMGAPEGISKLHDEAIGQITAAIKLPRKSLTEGGEAIQEGLVDYEDLSAAMVDRAYALARMKGTPEFDLAPALAVARNIKAGALAQAKDGSGTMQLQELPAGIADEIKKLENIDPSLPSVTMPDGTVMTATDQLRALRQNLWHMKQSGPTGLMTPEQRRVAADASKLYAAITRVLNTPKNGDKAFVKAWQAANAEAKKRFDTLEKIIIVQASKSETPAQLAQRLVQPYQVDNLRVLKETLDADPKTAGRWEVFQRAAQSDFIAPNNINNLTKRLQQFDQETIDTIFPRGTQQTLRQIGRQVDRLNRAGIKEAVEKQGKLGEIVRELTNRSDRAGLDEFVKRIGVLAPTDARRKTVRAGVMEDVWNSVVRRTDEGLEINGMALAGEIKRLRDTGAYKLLAADDMRILGKFDKIVGFLKSTEDAGTSLQAASTAANLRSLSTTAFYTLAEVIGTGRTFTSDWGQRILLGTGAERLPFASMRILNAALANEATDLERSAEDEEVQP